MKQFIQEVRNGGKLIILSDGTKYKVSDFDAFYTALWMVLDKVSVEHFRMTNHDRRDKPVDVQQVL